ncbi:putative HNH endonuclease [Vibrio phage phiKT1028]|nr:putative HNH endonuclease [Vibrio phage phiKT1028]
MLKETFLRDHILPKDVLDKDVYSVYKKCETSHRSGLLYTHLVEALEDDPDYELWAEHYQWNGSFFEIPGLYVSSKGRLYDSVRGQFGELVQNEDTGYMEYHYETSLGKSDIEVHRAVGSVFVPSYIPIPMSQLQPVHKDLDPTNNNFNNLEWNRI